MAEMFSRRSAWDRSPNPLTRALQERRERGAPVLDLSSSNPAACGLAWDDAELRRLLGVSGSAAHHPEPCGLAACREAIAAWWRERGVPAAAEHLVLTASTSEAYSFLFRLLCDPGDSVAVPRPGYPLFDFLAGLDGLGLRSAPLRLDEGRWRLDLETLADGLDEHTRAVVVVQPNNPTGSRLSEPEARALARLCAERGLALVSDEVFAELDWPGREASGPRSLLACGAEEGALTFALSGLSKPAGLPQLKLAWTAVAGPAALRDEALERLEWIGDTWLSVAAPVQLAAGALLAASERFRERCVQRLGASLALLDEGLAGTGLRRLEGEAGWSAVVELPAGLDEERLALELIECEGVVVHPGSFFGLRPPGHLVVSLLTPEETLQRGLAALTGRVARGQSPCGGQSPCTDRAGGPSPERSEVD